MAGLLIKFLKTIVNFFKFNGNGRKRRPANVLDVKLRANRIRSERTRMAAVGLGLAFATIFGFYIAWITGQMLLNQFVYRNPKFAVQTIDVQCEGNLSADQLRRWSGVRVGDNLMALDLSRVKRDLEMVSQIKSVAVERLLPGVLRLRVVEREPVAEVHVYRPRKDGSLEAIKLNLDSDGFVFTLADNAQQASSSKETNSTLTVLTGIDAAELIPCRQVASRQVHAAVDLISAFSHSPMVGILDLQSIDVSDPDVLQASTSQGTIVTFADGDLERQLRRWREIYNQSLRLSRVLATLDLSVANGIPATWAAQAPVTQPAPAPRQYHHNPRNKNV